MSKKIIFDVMGNDNGVKAGVLAAVQFVKSNIEYKIILVGDQDQIKKYCSENEQIEIIHNPNVVKKSSEDLLDAHKEDNSMNAALKLLKENKGLAVLSSGDSGKYLASSIMIIKRLPNVSRPAFMSIIPTIKQDKKFLLLDEGANLKINEEYLIQWAKLGFAFSKNVLKVNNPKVSILNIGTEDFKGFEYHQKANQILKESKLKFEYLGFIESRYLLEGIADVVVADGYSGNITLKALEGTVLSFTKLLKNKIRKNIWRKMCAFFMKNTFKDIKEQLDYRNVGAAWIIGLNGIVIKAHGASDQKAYMGALNQIKLAIESNALEEFKKSLEE
ncbi:phosphate acyltransferase PlsX [Mesomycoplasma moatsii]|uniref:phosphate acyltransferase PlsX n=1 Tax=Mesomycoplasma moatsii TaxID=171287 RepID=UPI0003B333E7